jgi:hypothetical protein
MTKLNFTCVFLTCFSFFPIFSMNVFFKPKDLHSYRKTLFPTFPLAKMSSLQAFFNHYFYLNPPLVFLRIQPSL